VRGIECALRTIEVALVPMRLADVGQNFGMRELALDIPRFMRGQRAGQIGGHAETFHRLRQLALVETYSTDPHQRIGALREGFVRDVGVC
jgi:hypothetical protein